MSRLKKNNTCCSMFGFYLQKSSIAEELFGSFPLFHSLAKHFLSPVPPPSDRNTAKNNTPWDTLGFSSFFSSNALFSLLTYSSRSTSLIYQNLNLNLLFYHVSIFSPFPSPFSQSCAPSPTDSFELMPPVAVPSASPAHPVGTSVDLRPGDSEPRPAASGAFSPLSPKCYSLAAAAHSESWSLWTKHKCQLVTHYKFLFQY